MKRIYLILLLLAWCGFAMGQDVGNFTYEAKLPKVEKTGFYKILLKPEHTGRLNNRLSDIRLYDDHAAEVPYLLEKERRKQHYTLFQKYEILEEKRVPKRYSVYTVHNPDKKAINNLNLIIKNADVKKEMKLMGSDDQQEWFAVKERSIISSINNHQGTSEIKLLDFPLSNYKYFRLEISDSLSSPIQITSIGYYDHFSKSGNYQEINPVAVVQKDVKEEKISMIDLVFPLPQLLDQLELEVEGSLFYYRNARLEVKKSGGKMGYYQLVEEFTLNSFTPHVLMLEALKADTLRIVIENKDNPPLKVSAKGWQLNRYLVASLQKEKEYTIKFGNKALAAPAYDLQYFRDSIPTHTPVIEPLEIKTFEAKVAATESKSFFNSKLYIWAAIILMAGMLGYVTLKMVKEMEKKKV